MADIATLLADPHAWVALLTLSTLEIVLGIDNIVVIAILTARLPPERQPTARRTGLALALITRLGLLGAISGIMHGRIPKAIAAREIPRRVTLPGRRNIRRLPWEMVRTK